MQEQWQSSIINDYQVDNKWIIPYNHDQTVQYDCHMNVMRCKRTKAIKYLYKYKYMGHNLAAIVIETILGYTNGRQRH